MRPLQLTDHYIKLFIMQGLWLVDYYSIDSKFVKMVPENSPENKNAIDYYLEELVKILQMESNHISPQLKRRLECLTDSNDFKKNINNGRYELVRRIASVNNRLLVELVQAHYNTKQREQDLRRLIESLGCSILEPELTDAVIDLLVKLYKAAGQCTDTSFERDVLIKYLLMELGHEKKKLIGKVVQTLYRSSCFNIRGKEGEKARFELKEGLHNALDLRQKHDIEMIELAQTNHIRLTAESWAYLLHGRSDSQNVARMQSLLDKQQSSVKVSELEEAIGRVGDKYSINSYLNDLQQLQDLTTSILNEPNISIELVLLNDLMRKLVKVKHLFTVRQRRS